MKNIEWGAVAILSQSKYGKDGEIGINNIGCMTGTEQVGNSTSTTGNTYGIYDTSGGTWDIVAGRLNPSGNWKEPYADIYAGSGKAMAKIGDATEETAGWYSDYVNYIATQCFFHRGGGYPTGILPGVFAFGTINMNVAYNHIGFCPVLCKLGSPI